MTAVIRRTRCALLALAAVVGLPLAAWADDDFSGFSGRWRAVAMESSDPEATKAVGLEHLSGRVEVNDDEIRLRGSALIDTGGESLRLIPSAVDLDFFRSDRPDVLVPMDAKSKLLGGLISDAEVVDPLKGETLRWARGGAGELVFYRFSINETGGFVLGKYVFTLEGDGMTLAFTGFAQNRPPLTITATLERVGD